MSLGAAQSCSYTTDNVNGKALLTFPSLTVCIVQVDEHCCKLPGTGHGFIFVMMILRENSVLNSAVFLKNYIICVS